MKPNSRDLLDLLITLYADQMGVTITYDVVEREDYINEESRF